LHQKGVPTGVLGFKLLSLAFGVKVFIQIGFLGFEVGRLVITVLESLDVQVVYFYLTFYLVRMETFGKRMADFILFYWRAVEK
jgi:hypothetical protein